MGTFFERRGELVQPCCQENPLGSRRPVLVPQTDTGRQGEYPKARERTLAKELGKMAP